MFTGILYKKLQFISNDVGIMTVTKKNFSKDRPKITPPDPAR